MNLHKRQQYTQKDKKEKTKNLSNQIINEFASGKDIYQQIL